MEFPCYNNPAYLFSFSGDFRSEKDGKVKRVLGIKMLAEVRPIYRPRTSQP